MLDAEREETEASTSMPKMRAQINLEQNETSIIVSILKPTFWCFFQIKKKPLYAQVMTKKPTTAPETSSLEKYNHCKKIDGCMVVN